MVHMDGESRKEYNEEEEVNNCIYPLRISATINNAFNPIRGPINKNWINIKIISYILDILWKNIALKPPDFLEKLFHLLEKVYLIHLYY